MTYIDLSILPKEHPMRNTHLSAIKARYRHLGVPADTRTILASWKIAQKTFNELGPAWFLGPTIWEAVDTRKRHCPICNYEFEELAEVNICPNTHYGENSFTHEQLITEDEDYAWCQ